MKNPVEKSIEKLKKIYIKPDKLLKSRMDSLSFDVAITIITEAINNGKITKEMFIEELNK